MKFVERKVNLYSRPRFNIPTIKNKQNSINGKEKTNNKIGKRNKKTKQFYSKYYSCILIIITMITTIYVVNTINPIIDRIAVNELSNKMTRITNYEAENIMQNYKYDDLVTVIFDKDKNISMIQAKTNNINSISHTISINVLDKLKENSNSNITIYMGNLLGIPLLSGTGPKINTKISSTGNVSTELKSEFSSRGINQTLHRIYLDISMNVSILTPYHTVYSNVKSEVLLSESIIIGNVPDAYYYLNSDNFDDLNNLTQ